MPSKLQNEINKLRGEVSATGNIYTDSIALLRDALTDAEDAIKELQSTDIAYNSKINKAYQIASSALKSFEERTIEETEELIGGLTKEISVSNDILYTNSTEKTWNTAVYTKKKETKLATISGTARISFSIHSNGSDNTLGKIYINGVAQGTQRITVSSSYQTYTEDFTVSSTDLIQVYIASGNGQTSYVKDLIIKGVLTIPKFTSQDP